MRRIARAASKWWAEQLVRVDDFQYLDGTQTYEESAAAILFTPTKEILTKQQISEFRKGLEQEILSHMKHHDNMYLYSKYYPCEILEHYGNLANIEGLQFPWFLKMVITKEGFIAQAGVNGPITEFDALTQTKKITE